jgi:hypothetical protein
MLEFNAALNIEINDVNSNSISIKKNRDCFCKYFASTAYFNLMFSVDLIAFVFAFVFKLGLINIFSLFQLIIMRQKDINNFIEHMFFNQSTKTT